MPAGSSCVPKVIRNYRHIVPECECECVPACVCVYIGLRLWLLGSRRTKQTAITLYAGSFWPVGCSNLCGQLATNMRMHMLLERVHCIFLFDKNIPLSFLSVCVCNFVRLTCEIRCDNEECVPTSTMIKENIQVVLWSYSELEYDIVMRIYICNVFEFITTFDSSSL